MINGHGDDLYRYGYKVKHNFSSNILQRVDHSGLYEAMAKSMPDLTSYPDPEPLRLERMMATCAGVDDSDVMATNGATEAIYTLASCFKGATSAIMTPTFSEYADACRLSGHKVISFTDINAMPCEAIDCVWICNPNNPTGSVIDKRIIVDKIKSHPQITFILDHAYCDYSERDMISEAEGVEMGNVVMLYSMTKRYSVPGLRLGYAVGSARIIDKMKGRRMPWSINKVSEQAAIYLMEHASEYLIDAHALHAEALRISEAFRSMGLTVEDTDCNFLLSRLPEGSSRELKERLMSEYGILIRDASNFEGLTSGHFRVAAQTPEQNDLLIDALAKCIG